MVKGLIKLFPASIQSSYPIIDTPLSSYDFPKPNVTLVDVAEKNYGTGGAEGIENAEI